jgi:hypothetical protein
MYSICCQLWPGIWFINNEDNHASYFKQILAFKYEDHKFQISQIENGKHLGTVLRHWFWWLLKATNQNQCWVYCNFSDIPWLLFCIAALHIKLGTSSLDERKWAIYEIPWFSKVRAIYPRLRIFDRLPL